MFRRVTLFVAAVCLFQGLNGLPINDLINELKPRLDEASAKISQVLREGGQKIGHTYKAIELAISVLDNDLNQKSDELEESVKQAKADAEAAGKNIDQCVDQVNNGLGTWDRASLETCRKRPELKRLSIKLGQVAKLEGAVATSVTWCSERNPGDVEKIRVCVEVRVADIEKQAEQAAVDIAATAASEQENANRCANDAASNLRTQLQTLKDDFSNCVNNTA